MGTAEDIECSKSFMGSWAVMKNGCLTGMGILGSADGVWCWLHICPACSDTDMYGCDGDRGGMVLGRPRECEFNKNLN